MISEIIKIRKTSFLSEIISFIILIISGSWFFNNNTMMISDNILMEKISRNNICEKCEKEIFFVSNDIKNKSTNIYVLVQYALLNNLIDLEYKKTNVLNKYAPEKYIIKEYNIPDYYVNYNSTLYTFGLLTSLDNAQTKNYTHNNIITEYIILIYSLIGKILIGVILYKIFLIRSVKNNSIE